MLNFEIVYSLKKYDFTIFFLFCFQERREKKNRLKAAKDNFNTLLTESKLSARTTYSEFANKFSKEDRFKGIEKSRERESLFNEYMIEIKKKDREERTAKKEQAKKEFVAMLKEFAEDPDNGIDRYTINIKYITPSPQKIAPVFRRPCEFTLMIKQG